MPRMRRCDPCPLTPELSRAEGVGLNELLCITNRRAGMVERKEVGQIVVLGGTDADAARFVEEDFRIRSGMCPN